MTDRALHQCPSCLGWHDWPGICLPCANTRTPAGTVCGTFMCGKGDYPLLGDADDVTGNRPSTRETTQ